MNCQDRRPPLDGFAQKVGEMNIPRLSKAGSPSDPTLERSGGAVRNEPRSAPYLLKLLTAPSAPLRNGAILLMAQPPRLSKLIIHALDTVSGIGQ